MKLRSLFSLMFATACVLEPCRAAEERPPELTPVQAPAVQNKLSDRATDVLLAFTRFPESNQLENLVESGDAELIAIVRKSMDSIRPCCEMLRALPPEQVKELVLLADAVLWQGQWLYGMYLGEFGIEVEAPFDVGLWDLSHSARLLQQVLSGKKRVSPEVESLLRELVQLVGGEQVLTYPAAWCDEQLCRDYKTALQFYKDFCAAASAENEAQVIELLREQEQVLAYFTAKGEGEIWRVNRLALIFRTALEDLRFHGEDPYPQLSVGNRPPSVMKALQPFFAVFPALKELLQP
ncbi:MAG: hypothetical protein IJ985_01990 [Akkermansia sp.]|nr:hypothetical protein [Akkermansia sp.]